VIHPRQDLSEIRNPLEVFSVSGYAYTSNGLEHVRSRVAATCGVGGFCHLSGFIRLSNYRLKKEELGQK
jgi:hypothetical protein